MSRREKGTMNINVPIPDSEKLKCMDCQGEFETKAKISCHVKKHGYKNFEEYLVVHYMNGKAPTCALDGCENKTRYYSGQYFFKKYCGEHASVAKSEWSKKHSTLDYGWRKGLTKEDHPGIAAQAEKISGENNPWFGKQSEALKDSKEEREKGIREHALHRFFEFCEEVVERDIEVLTPPALYTDTKDKNIRFMCRKCDKEFINSIGLIKSSTFPCPHCRPTRVSAEAVEKIASTLRLSREEYIEKCKNNEFFHVLTPYSDYERQKDQKLSVECVTCGDRTTRTLATLNNKTMCWKCNARSIQEREIQEFLESYNIPHQRNTREVLNNKELDFFCLEHKLAIEFNGLYWHSEENKSKDYHLNKTMECKELDIQLFHIFEDEWRDKQTIIESMILHRLNASPNTIYARNCELREVTKTEEKAFTNETHISGFSGSSVAFGLYFEDELVACISLRKPMNSKKYNGSMEIARFSTKLFTSVVGGLSKLLKKAVAWCKENDYSGIMTYADMRFGYGDGYEKCGFQLVGKTVLDYWYTDLKHRYNRTKFRAQDGKTEKEVAMENGVLKIFGCGSKIFMMEFDDEI